MAVSLCEEKKGQNGKNRFLKMNLDLYLMVLPGIILVVLFNYLPMYGAMIAFKNYNIIKRHTGKRLGRHAKFLRTVSCQ